MGRPRIIDPDGRTKDINVLVAYDVYETMLAAAKRRKVSLGTVVREVISAGIPQCVENAGDK